MTIPKPVHDLLGIIPDSVVAFELAADGRIVLVRVDPNGAAERPASRFARLRSDTGLGLTTDQIMMLTRNDASP